MGRPRLRLVTSRPPVATRGELDELAALDKLPPAPARVSVEAGAVEHLDMAARARLPPADAFDRLPVPLGWDFAEPPRPRGDVAAGETPGQVRERVRVALEALHREQRSITKASVWSPALDAHTRKLIEAQARRLAQRMGDHHPTQGAFWSIRTICGWAERLGYLRAQHERRRRGGPPR